MKTLSFVTDRMHKKLERFLQDGLECSSKEMSLPFLEYGKVLESAKYWLSQKIQGKTFRGQNALAYYVPVSDAAKKLYNIDDR